MNRDDLRSRTEQIKDKATKAADPTGDEPPKDKGETNRAATSAREGFRKARRRHEGDVEHFD
jgi:uncharacterized protein YjbJ (UPF0337 family)